MVILRDLYPAIEPYVSGRLGVDEIHSLYWEECGNPNGIPVVFLHGGPGGGCSASSRRFFDPARYRVILFDQRGAGRSTPNGELRNNTTAHLIADIETLRKLRSIEAWHVFGGSWVSTLAVAYAQEFPEACLSLTLRGIFLMREWEIRGVLRGGGDYSGRRLGEQLLAAPAARAAGRTTPWRPSRKCSNIRIVPSDSRLHARGVFSKRPWPI